jgi:hypothetical protein
VEEERIRVPRDVRPVLREFAAETAEVLLELRKNQDEELDWMFRPLGLGLAAAEPGEEFVGCAGTGGR